jgi:predicted NAD/FAD-binding protein
MPGPEPMPDLERMRIAVIGSGIAGLASAWLLSRRHDVVLFEADKYLGGHTHTHDVEIDGRRIAVDSGFIVFNPRHYPLLSDFFAELGVASKPTTMSFSVQDARSGLEYNTNNFAGLFAQRRNLGDAGFWRMLGDIWRFYRAAPALLDDAQPNWTVGEYLHRQHYSDLFRDDHLVPMASALWSSSAAQILDFPLKHLLRFMANHQMLQIVGRPQWRVVDGGSQTYVRALQEKWRAQVRLDSPVRSVRREHGSVLVDTAQASETFDHVVLALLTDADTQESSILGAMKYQRNDVVLHTDTRLLPAKRAAWAAWNAYVPVAADAECTVSYCMNILQSLDAPRALVVTLNRTQDIDPAKILWRGDYDHPLQTNASAAAQKRKAEIQGRRNTWFAGAYWGFGFHEDGLRSGVEVANALGVAWP